MSVPLFIFAATICRLFEDPYLDPIESLADVLEYRNVESKLDGTYRPVLDRLLVRYSGTRQRQVVEDVRQILGTIIILETPLSIASLSELTGVPKSSINARLGPLHSVLDIPDDETMPIRLFHLSFRDFLLHDNTRDKTPFWIDECEANLSVTGYCLGTMHRQLKKNICGLKNYGTERMKIGSYLLHKHVRPELQYSCRYWIHHLTQSMKRHDTMNLGHVLAFLEAHFLHWVEVMGLFGLVSECLEGLSVLLMKVRTLEDSQIFEFLQDAKRFIFRILQIADYAPLQIYAFGLVFAPSEAIIRKRFVDQCPEYPDWVTQFPRVSKTWGPELQLLVRNSSESNSVSHIAMSSDGRVLATGSSDGTIRMWDPTSGALRHSFSCQLYLNYLAFLPKSQLVASGSWRDQTINFWNATTGTLLRTIRISGPPVSSAVFSPDGLITAGHVDGSITLCDPDNGTVRYTFRCRPNPVVSMAFSPDGHLLAAGSNSTTDSPYGAAVTVLDVTNGTIKYMHGPPECDSNSNGRRNTVSTVAFCPRGRLLGATFTDSNAIRVWDSNDGIVKYTFRGNYPVGLAFSTDGRMLAYSCDKDIKVWNTSGLEPEQTLQSHTSVEALAFSPDSQLLMSGSYHGATIWDPAVKEHYSRERKTHNTWAFSADGRMLATATRTVIEPWTRTSVKSLKAKIYSRTCIRLWNAENGMLEQTLEDDADLGHMHRVIEVYC
ncbi:uncharacterized protein DSM5745_06061 [Aspergillus mulundensis]|uniref:Mitochondrial division protein 1 n=1 Tax=Aspergillus mulundensis TaxID=1810919 RepID=A0A3D8RYT5_9EURO|nr:hypothetical protein DSM5745_06061 [Aspergillus mulundensis]RDW79209.1 hypothetical protein DSM5745_06061 [Aspergillus mulundensis]